MNRFKFKIVVFERKTDSNEWKFVEFIEDNNKWSLTTCGDIVSDCRFLAHYNRQNAPESVGRVYEPLFCTGLKDKNGKLIFEGDILKYVGENPEWYNHRLFKYHTIISQNECMTYWADIDKIDDGWNQGLKLGLHKELEIIGNIYENKDLLNASI